MDREPHRSYHEPIAAEEASPALILRQTLDQISTRLAELDVEPNDHRRSLFNELRSRVSSTDIGDHRAVAALQSDAQKLLDQLSNAHIVIAPNER